MLQAALRAHLPLIVCHTTDTVNVESVLAHLARVRGLTTLKMVGNTMSGQYIYQIGPPTHSDWVGMIEKMLDKERTLILVNPEQDIPEAFDAGEVPVPISMVKQLLKQYMKHKNKIEGAMQALAGLTLKEMGEVLRLSETLHHSTTVDSLQDIRRRVHRNVRGVVNVDTGPEFYWKSQRIEHYIQSIGHFLTAEVDYRLRPRGLLLAGIPGTGKTVGAKRIARGIGVPLMRLDLGIVMSKYVGESEANLAAALARVEEAQPCTMLVDEVEKLFHGDDESGVTQNLLAGLLWWMQEHRAAVLTVMTTNDESKLPPELIRPGRIDQRIELPKAVPKSSRQDFFVKALDSLGYPGIKALTKDEQDQAWTYASLFGYAKSAVRKKLTNDKP